jgi:hypothetical protein
LADISLTAFWKNIPLFRIKPRKNPTRSRWQSETACNLLLAGILISLLFDPEDGGSMFLQNIGSLLSDYLALHAKIPNRSKSAIFIQ